MVVMSLGASGLTRNTTGMSFSSPAAKVWLEKQKQDCFSMYLPAFDGAALVQCWKRAYSATSWPALIRARCSAS